MNYGKQNITIPKSSVDLEELLIRLYSFPGFRKQFFKSKGQNIPNYFIDSDVILQILAQEEEIIRYADSLIKKRYRIVKNLLAYSLHDVKDLELRDLYLNFIENYSQNGIRHHESEALDFGFWLLKQSITLEGISLQDISHQKLKQNLKRDLRQLCSFFIFIGVQKRSLHQILFYTYKKVNLYL